MQLLNKISTQYTGDIFRKTDQITCKKVLKSKDISIQLNNVEMYHQVIINVLYNMVK